MRSISALRTLMTFPLALGAVILLSSCDGTPASGVTCSSDLGQTDSGKKVRLFIDTSNALVVAANDIDADMQEVCLGMGEDLGIPNAELLPAAGTERNAGAATRAACTRVKTEIDDIIKKDVPAAARLSITYTPAVCTVDAKAQTICVQKCEPKNITVTELECVPGHVYGQCSATCSGTCGGSCSGSCQGQCTATCNGTCSGPCMGSCDAMCTGSCSGSCNGTCNATCSGGCEGNCSAWIQPPQCTEVQKTVVVDECQTTCESQAKFEAICTEPTLTVNYGVATSTERVGKLLKAVKNHYGLLLKVAVRTGTTIGDSVSNFSTALSGVSTYAKDVGAQATLCVVDAIDAVGAAATQVEVSASFSVSISASVTASGGAAAQ